jgi:hypothetical protein
LSGPGFDAALTPDGSHLDDLVQPGDLMNEALDPSVRELPSSLDVQIITTTRRDVADTPGQAPRGFTISAPAMIQDSSGWNVRGSASVSGPRLNLNEDPNVLTRLTRSFTIPPGVRLLRFTVDRAQFGNNGPQPPDAFEAALLDADTMAPVVAPVAGLSDTDAFFNLQATGEAYYGSQVTVCGLSQSGGRPPLAEPLVISVDMSRVPAGTHAVLYLDLLGFGPATSSVIVDSLAVTNGTAGGSGNGAPGGGSQNPGQGSGQGGNGAGGDGAKGHGKEGGPGGSSMSPGSSPQSQDAALVAPAETAESGNTFALGQGESLPQTAMGAAVAAAVAQTVETLTVGVQPAALIHRDQGGSLGSEDRSASQSGQDASQTEPGDDFWPWQQPPTGRPGKKAERETDAGPRSVPPDSLPPADDEPSAEGEPVAAAAGEETLSAQPAPQGDTPAGALGWVLAVAAILGRVGLASSERDEERRRRRGGMSS